MKSDHSQRALGLSCTTWASGSHLFCTALQGAVCRCGGQSHKPSGKPSAVSWGCSRLPFMTQNLQDSLGQECSLRSCSHWVFVLGMLQIHDYQCFVSLLTLEAGKVRAKFVASPKQAYRASRRASCEPSSLLALFNILPLTSLDKEIRQTTLVASGTCHMAETLCDILRFMIYVCFGFHNNIY